MDTRKLHSINFVEKVKFNRFLYFTFAGCALIHVILLVVFLTEGYLPMQIITAISTCIYLFCIYLIFLRKLDIAIFLSFTTATFYGFIATCFLGWNVGFYLYIILGYVHIFFLLKHHISTKVFISIPITVALLLLYYFTIHHVQDYLLGNGLLSYLPFFNLSMTLLVICVFAFYYTSFMAEVEHDMKESLEVMQITQTNLQYQIEENKTIHEALIRENARMDALMTHLPDYIYFKDNTSRFTRISQSMLKVFSVKNVSEMIGKSDMDIHNLNVAMKFKADEDQVMHTRIGIVDQLQHEFLLNGLEQWVSTTKLPLLDNHGNCIGTFGISKDVTYLKTLEIEAQAQAMELRLRESELENKEAEQRLLNQQKIKFFSVFSHDLKNPLSTLAGFTSLLWEKFDVYDEVTKKRMLHNLVKLSDNMQGLIMNLLDWSRSQLNHVAVNPVSINLRKITEDIVHLYSYQQHEKDIHSEIRIDGAMNIVADVDIIKTVFRNLYFNAIKFTHVHGDIEISALQTNQEVQIIFKDNGVGLLPKEVAALFTIGESKSGIGTMNERGTGLGLIVCQEYLSKCNAYIKVESEKDKGSKFIVCLPIIPDISKTGNE